MLENRLKGSLIGLAVGDALGSTYEFNHRPLLPEKLEMEGGGPFELAPGEWTDDTSQALCLAESLLAQRGFDARDQMLRYLRWAEFGHLSSRLPGHPNRRFDIGITTRAALKNFSRMQKREGFCGNSDPETSGNGSLMRLAPVPIYYRNTPPFALQMAADSSRTTHAAREAVDCCVYFCGLLLGAFAGASKSKLIGEGPFEPFLGVWSDYSLDGLVTEVARGSFRGKLFAELRGSGYVIHTLESALWAFWSTDSFEDGCRAVISRTPPLQYSDRSPVLIMDYRVSLSAGPAE